MTDSLPGSCTSFDGFRCIATGSLLANALAARNAIENGATGPVLIFDDTTGRSIDVDTRGSDKDVATRLAAAFPEDRQQFEPASPSQSPDATAADGTQQARGRGRPKLGVVPREVTLLPRHWEWLAGQPGGASVALRKLVEEARRSAGSSDTIRKAHERAYHFMTAIAGDLPGFEEATRALFANDRSRFDELVATWPADVRKHAARLAFGDSMPPSSANR